jgi:NAD(P)-dependent dehydrogenase (short-subunit alcohol dehydrogenase family)
VVEELARQKAQIVLLVRNHTDSWTIEFIEDLRRRTENQLIYAETCNLNSLHSVRDFATKWINTTPPRRLDMLICNAAVLAPPTTRSRQTVDEFDQHWGINYLAHYHLINLLSPAIKAQPPDRDVRIILTTCALYAVGKLNPPELSSSWKSSGSSKLALMTAAQGFQREFDSYIRPDKSPNKVRVYCVDPGLVRTPMLRGFVSWGSIWGLLLYLLFWPFWFLLLKSAWQGAQTILHCAMSPVDYSDREEEGWTHAAYYRDCRKAKYQREELLSVGEWEGLKKRTDKEIVDAEKKSAIRKVDEAKRNDAKKK